MSDTTLVAMGGLAGASVAFIVTYLTVPRLVAKVLPRMVEALVANEEENPMIPEPEPEERKFRFNASAVIITGLCVALCVLGLQFLFKQQEVEDSNKERDQRTACSLKYAEQMEDWGSKVTVSLQASRDATRGIREADQEWHIQVDAIFQLLFRSNAGEELPPDEVTKIIEDYQKAKAALFKAYTDAANSAALNPYPALDLNCDEDQPEKQKEKER